MQRARFPARQLNSRTIKSAALGYLSPVFLGKCSILCTKCVCKVQEDGFEKAWNNVCRTRDACDSALGNLDCNKWFIWFETRLAWWPHRSSPISVASLISTSKTGVHFKLCFLLKLPRNFWSSEFLFPSLLKLETLKFFSARY